MRDLLRYIGCLALVFCISLLSVACSSTPTLRVKSTDYDISVLKAFELNDAFCEKYANDQYDAFYAYVSATNSYGDVERILVVNNDRDSHVRMINSMGGYFVGLDHTEFASGIYYVPYSGSNRAETHKVSERRCVGLFDGSASGEFCYAITAWNCFDEDTGEESIKLCKVIPPDDIQDECVIETVCDIAVDSAVACIRTADGVFYVITPTSFYSVTSDGTVTPIQVPRQWLKLHVTSMVEIGNRIYIGTKYGVLEYGVSEESFTWFPVEYSEAV